MKNILYDCDKKRNIVEVKYEEKAHFSIVQKYEILYKKEWRRFKRQSTKAYAQPRGKTPEKLYHGLDRKGQLLSQSRISDYLNKIYNRIMEEPFYLVNEIMQTEESVSFYLQHHRNAKEFEVIWSRIASSDEAIPEGYQFIGYDVAYPPDENGGFSMINDCMFICNWHGCDDEGTFFLDDFEKLNLHGLFDAYEDAYAYMMRYLKEEWAEIGTFGIFEVYMKLQ